jgi:hypothetical protein
METATVSSEYRVTIHAEPRTRWYSSRSKTPGAPLHDAASEMIPIKPMREMRGLLTGNRHRTAIEREDDRIMNAQHSRRRRAIIGAQSERRLARLCMSRNVPNLEPRFFVDGLIFSRELARC